MLARALLSLVAHPLEIVSLTAVGESCRLWAKDPKLAWSALALAFSLCHIWNRSAGQPRGPNEGVHTKKKCARLSMRPKSFIGRSHEWRLLPAPPPAWVKLDNKNRAARRLSWHGHSRKMTRLIRLRSGSSQTLVGILNTPRKSFRCFR